MSSGKHSPHPAGPWVEHRALAESVGQAVADALTNAIGSNVVLGVATSFLPEEELGSRPLPMRAHLVRFRRPLRDVMVFLSPLKEDLVRPLVEVAAKAAVAALDIPTGSDEHGPIGAFELEESYEYETMEIVLEQCDGLFLEAGYTLNLPIGELHMVLGTGLLESASSFVHGTPDPFAEEPAYALPGTELELGDAIELDDEPRVAFGPDGEPLVEAGIAVAAGAGVAAASGIDAFEAQLAAQEQADAAAIAGSNAAATAGGAMHAGVPADVAALDTAEARRWADLLSGVEVELSAELGRTQLALGDITALDSASVLTLDQLINDPVTVYVNGTEYASARLVVVDGEYGIEILEILDQGALATSLAA